MQLTVQNPIIYAATLSIIVGFLRSVCGYIENLINNKNEKFSMSKLADTIVRAMPQILGLEAIIPGSGAGAFVTDYLIKKIKQ